MGREYLMDDRDWMLREEAVAAMGDVIDFGYGPDLLSTTGMAMRQLSDLLAPLKDGLIDGGANVVKLALADQAGGTKLMTLYVRRRKKHVDVGTRPDFEALGWGALCDYMDARVNGAG